MRLDTRISSTGELPASLDWADVWVFSRAKRPLVVLELPTSTSIRAQLPTSGGYLRRHAADFGLAPTSKSGRIPEQPTEWEVWHTSSGLIVRLATGSRGTLARISSDQVRSQSNLTLGEPVDLLVTPLSPSSFRTVAEFLRASGADSIAGQATVGAVPHHATEPRYVYLNSRGEELRSLPAHASIFVDQNVLVDLKSALNPDSGRRFDVSELRDQMGWVAQLDGIPGFAIGECLVAMDRPAADSLRAAWDAWATGCPGSDSTSTLRAGYVAALKTYEAAPLQTRPAVSAGRGLCALNYLALLEAIEPYNRLRGRRFNGTEHIDAFEHWIGRLNQPRIGMPGHMGHAIHRLLLGKPGSDDGKNAEKLLKLGKKRPPTIEDLCGAAYDMIYPTLCDMASARELPGQFSSEVFVMTADKPMAKARRDVTLAPITIDGPAGRAGYLASEARYLQAYSDRQIQRIYEINDQLELDANIRSSSGLTCDLRHVNAQVDRVEADLLSCGLIRHR